MQLDSAPRHFAGELYVSHSQLSTYLLCSERFRLKYVKGLVPAHRNGDMVFGSAIHAALASFHENLRVQGDALSTEALEGEFTRAFRTSTAGDVPVLWADDDSPDELEKKGRALVARYAESRRNLRVLAVEKPFKVAPGRLPRAFKFEHRLVGVIDLIEQDADGGVCITEIKTAGRKFDDVRLRYDLQLGLYAAAREELGIPSARLRFVVLLKTKQPRIEIFDVRRDLAQISEAGRVATQVVRAIENGIFFPQRGWACTTCPFRSACGD